MPRLPAAKPHHERLFVASVLPFHMDAHGLRCFAHTQKISDVITAEDLVVVPLDDDPTAPFPCSSLDRYKPTSDIRRHHSNAEG